MQHDDSHKHDVESKKLDTNNFIPYGYEFKISDKIEMVKFIGHVHISNT